ncbi:type 2 periplasmic-binding domain-containing protein [Aeromonas veronii]|uniref:hypothetical protein n=1 Tax=Aeromonas veronii TaxID=654 RepID=UPI001F35C29B
MRRLLPALASLALFIALPAPALIYYSEQNMPLNGQDKNGQPVGLAVELLRLMWREMGEPEQLIHFLPWARGWYLLTQQQEAVLFTTAHTKERDPHFLWVCPISHSRVALGRVRLHWSLFTPFRRPVWPLFLWFKCRLNPVFCLVDGLLGELHVSSFLFYKVDSRKQASHTLVKTDSRNHHDARGSNKIHQRNGCILNRVQLALVQVVLNQLLSQLTSFLA